MEIIYGPVSSWRLGRSLGIDPICSRGKICTFDCLYCSLGPTSDKTMEREIFVSAGQITQALKKVMNKVEADVVTFSGTGEPTLAKNLGELIEVARDVSGLPVAVLTNSSLKIRADVRKDLIKADIVKGKLDVPNDRLLKKVNQPHEDIRFKDIVQGLKKFRAEFKGKFQLEVMFVPENKDFSEEIAKVVKTISPDEVQINTPLRPSSANPLSPIEISGIKKSFADMNVLTVFDAEKPTVSKAVGKKKIKRLKRV